MKTNKIALLAAALALTTLLMAGCAGVSQFRRTELVWNYEQLRAENSPDAMRNLRGSCPLCNW
jgi:hypothetical protein